MAAIGLAAIGTELDELDREEWWDVCRQVAPHLSREEFERLWTEFQERKQRTLH